jgi:XapX domain-containing protein
MIKILIGFVLAFLIGVLCRVADIPVPAPPALMGALLVMSMTVGFLAMERFEARSLEDVED